MIKFNHIGIAVQDLAHVRRLFQILGLDVSHTEMVAEQKVNTHFIPTPKSGTQLELLEPFSVGEGAVGQFLQKKGPGIHHLSFSVEKGELVPLCDRLRSEGFRLVYKELQPGAHGMKINFIHPSSAGGILIEIMEPS